MLFLGDYYALLSSSSSTVGIWLIFLMIWLCAFGGESGCFSTSFAIHHALDNDCILAAIFVALACLDYLGCFVYSFPFKKGEKYRLYSGLLCMFDA